MGKKFRVTILFLLLIFVLFEEVGANELGQDLMSALKKGEVDKVEFLIGKYRNIKNIKENN